MAKELKDNGFNCSDCWSMVSKLKQTDMFVTLVKENNLHSLLYKMSPSININEASEIICTLFFAPTTPMVVDPLGHFIEI